MTKFYTGPKTEAIPLNVVQADFQQPEQVDEPIWDDGSSSWWSDIDTENASKLWKMTVQRMKELGTFGLENCPQIESYCRHYARWLMAERDVNKRGPVILSARTQVEMHNPYLDIANKANTLAMREAAGLGLTPDMRGRVTKAIKNAKKGTAADAYLKRKVG